MSRRATTSYLAMLDIAVSARGHGVADEAMRHAVRNAMRFAPTSDPSLILYVGPDESGRLLEVGVLTTEHGPLIVHAMRARPKFLR